MRRSASLSVTDSDNRGSEQVVHAVPDMYHQKISHFPRTYKNIRTHLLMGEKLIILLSYIGYITRKPHQNTIGSRCRTKTSMCVGSYNYI